jgi:hypothetical protein
LAIVVVLFLIQRHGTSVVGRFFGPVMFLWFLSLALLGLYNIVKAPEVLVAINPYYAVHFMAEHSLQAFIVLGSVVLVLTGAEALYADMGHFGIKPIRYAWLFTVMPSLLINYFGQGQPDRQSQGHHQPLLPDDPRAAGAAHGGAGHLRHRDCVAGGDLGRLLADQPGHPAGLRAAHAHPAYLRG